MATGVIPLVHFWEVLGALLVMRALCSSGRSAFLLSSETQSADTDQCSTDVAQPFFFVSLNAL
jgi:hypothetical protein